MAKPVICIGVPHGPGTPQQVAGAQAKGETPRVGRLFNEVREQLEAARPDLVLEFTSDHFVNFFLDNYPAFAVPLIERADGPHEDPRLMPFYTVQSAPDFAEAFFEFGLESGFDLAACGEVRLDHSILVPLHFLTPRMDIPVVPLYIRGLAHPIPKAWRCYAYGRLLRKFVEGYPGDQRIAIVASGLISTEIGGPREEWHDAEWVATVRDAIARDCPSILTDLATSERIAQAGNAAGENLNWIALFGFMGDRRHDYLEVQGSQVFATWSLE